MGNLLLRVGFALSIVFAALGMTFAAPNSFVASEAATATPAASAASVQPVVAGYQAAPLSADAAAAASSSTQQSQQAATLIALVTTIVLLAIFVILFSYRPRPGGVRASHR
jgi:heme/copper-type cytochrome/quinol oxidase subunit 2